MSASICVRLPDETVRKLENLASTLDRTKSYLIKSAIENYFLEYADYMIALERLRDKDDEILSSKELRAHFGL